MYKFWTPIFPIVLPCHPIYIMFPSPMSNPPHTPPTLWVGPTTNLLDWHRLHHIRLLLPATLDLWTTIFTASPGFCVSTTAKLVHYQLHHRTNPTRHHWNLSRLHLHRMHGQSSTIHMGCCTFSPSSVSVAIQFHRTRLTQNQSLIATPIQLMLKTTSMH